MSKGYNVDLMIDVRNYLKEHPEEHDQGDWFSSGTNSCGTTMCIAGAAVFLAHGPAYAQAVARCHKATEMTSGAKDIEDVAAELLGLDEDESIELFYASRNRMALEMLDELIEAGKNSERVCWDEEEVGY
jgi:hypothetical protein